MIANRPVLLPLRPRDATEADRMAQWMTLLRDRAQEDHHMVIAPTHVMANGASIVGYLSLGGMPMVHAWFDSNHKHPLDSLRMIESGELVFRERGVNAFTVGVSPESPFAPHMERLGYTKLGTTVMWLKTL